MELRLKEEASTSLDVQAKTFNKNEFIRAIRQAIIAENDAINMYEKIIDSLSGEFEGEKKTLQSIANEEKNHIGEFFTILEKIAPDELPEYEKGKEEAKNNKK